MRYLIKVLGLMAPLLFAVGPNRLVSADERYEAKRMVLVELYTSQGCDMCPAAERVLGAWPNGIAGSCRSRSTSITSMTHGRTCFPTRCTASAR